MENKEIVLSVKDLKVNFSTDNGYVQAVRGVSFDLYKGETLCIVGESGSGKSVTSKTIMGILSANGRIASGSIMYEGEDLTKVSEDEFHRIRGRKIGMIFQDPLSSLNPIMRIGKQITEAMLLNGNRLKKMKEELVAKEFVAYKNAITAYKSEMSKDKEAVKFYKSEKKKEVERLKNIAKNESSGRIYALKQDYGLERVTIKHKYDSLAKEKPSEANSLKEKKNKLLKEAKERFEAAKAEIKAEVQAQKPARKEALINTKKEYDQKIKEAKAAHSANKPELKAKYKPLIAETKAAYLAKNKEAKAEVENAKQQYKEEYLVKNAEAVSALNAIVAERNEKITKVNQDTALDDASKQTKTKEIFKEYNKKIKEAQKAVNEVKREYISKIRITKSEAKARALEIMKEVGIPFPERRFKQYPFEFSGGMRQRIVIAIALTADPDILICDEPTTALDVTIQAQILELINRLKKERNMTCIFITHDLGVVANMADRVAVMYAGKIVESGREEEIFYDPKHPYTWALLSSIPDVDSKEKLDAIPGTPPNLIYPPQGDAFALRSKYAMKIDFKKEPPLFKVSDTHYAATWLLDKRAPKVEMPAIVKARIEASLAANKARLEKGATEEEPEEGFRLEDNLNAFDLPKEEAKEEESQEAQEAEEVIESNPETKEKAAKALRFLKRKGSKKEGK